MSFLKSPQLKTLELIYHMKFLVGALFAPQPPPPQAQIGGLYGIIDVIYEILTFVNPRIDISNNILSVGSFCPPPLQPPSMGVRGFVEKY